MTPLTDAAACLACGHGTRHDQSEDEDTHLRCAAVTKRTEYPCERHATYDFECDTPPPHDCWIGVEYCPCSSEDREIAELKHTIDTLRALLSDESLDALGSDLAAIANGYEARFQRRLREWRDGR
ncbi:MAG: hypothetical protein WC538_22000 [Thermoanaerobaculia bacterium]|jgi:hypothetical protein